MRFLCIFAMKNPLNHLALNYNNFCIIMAGGVGRRLWPVSRQEHPKQFIDFFGTGRSLLQMTYERMRRIIPDENIYVATSEEYADITRHQLPELAEEQLLLEPVRLSTAPAAAWASWHIAQHCPNANILVTPADQFITNEIAFEEDAARGLDFVATHDTFLSLAVPAANPNTAYGYIQKGREIGKNLYSVKSFTEKPPREYAETFVHSGEFLWNTGMFLWNVRTMEKLEGQIIPGIGHNDIIISSREEEFNLIRSCYPSAIRESLDVFLLEKQELNVMACTFAWSDVGSWPVMSETLHHTADGNAVIVTPAPGEMSVSTIEKPKVIFQNTKNTIVSVPDKVATVVRGLDGYLVALEGNVLIITPNDDPARMRHLSAELQVKYGEEYL